MTAFDAMIALVSPVMNRVKNLVARGVVDATDDAPKAQTLRVKVFATEVSSSVENFAGVPGLTTVTPEGTEVVLAHVGGMRDQPIVIAALDRSTRPAGEGSPGDVIVYHAAEPATRIHLKPGGVIEIEAPGGLNITGPTRIDGTLEVSGNITGEAQVRDFRTTLDAMRIIFDAHIHKENGKGGGITDPTFTPQSVPPQP